MGMAGLGLIAVWWGAFGIHGRNRSSGLHIGDGTEDRVVEDRENLSGPLEDGSDALPIVAWAGGVFCICIITAVGGNGGHQFAGYWIGSCCGAFAGNGRAGCMAGILGRTCTQGPALLAVGGFSGIWPLQGKACSADGNGAFWRMSLIFTIPV